MSEISRQRPRQLYVINPDEDSEDEKRTYAGPYGSGVYGTSRPPAGRSQPPEPVTTSVRTRLPRSGPSSQSLSSPSTTSSPIVDDIPNGADEPSFFANRPKLGHGPKSPLPPKPNYRPQPQPPAPSVSSVTRSHESPTAGTPESYTSMSALSDRMNILVTADLERFINVEIYGQPDGRVIRENIFSKLNISDDDQSRYSIYRTEIGEFALGNALSDQDLLDLCKHNGDTRGSLKLLVSHSESNVHNTPPLPSAPNNGMLSPSATTVPPPVLPSYQSSGSCAPLRPRRRSRSRHGSLSSSSEQLNPDVSGGYEADVDNATEREPPRALPVAERAIRPLPQIISPQSPGRRPNGPQRARSPLPSRSNTPSPPPVLRATSETVVVQDRYGHMHPAPPPPPLISPLRPTFSGNDEATLIPPPRRHVRSGSDASADRDRERERERDHFEEMPVSRYRGPSTKLEPSRRQRGGVVPRRTDSDEVQERAEGSSPAYPQRHSDEIDPSGRPAQKSRGPRHQTPISPNRFKPFLQPSQYSSRGLNIPPKPQHPPPMAPMINTDLRAGPSRPSGQQVPANYVVTYKAEEKGDQKAGSSSPSSPWSRSIKSAKSVDSLRAVSIPSALQPGRRSNAVPISRNNPNLTFAPKVRPLPAKGSSRPSTATSTTTAGGTLYPSAEPYPRPHSALSDVTTTSPTNRYPTAFADFASAGFTAAAAPIVRSRPSDSTSSPPQSPVTPASPRPSRDRLFTQSRSFIDDEQSWMDKAFGSNDGTIVGHPPEFKSFQSMSASDQRSSFPPQTPTYAASEYRGSDSDDSRSDSEGGGTMVSIWNVPPAVPQPVPSPNSRPVLTVDVTNTNGQTVSMQGPSTNSANQSSSGTAMPRRARDRGSTFTEMVGTSWAPRPPPEDVYDRLEEFFPEHDLDRPVIESAHSGGTSPTAGEVLPPPPPPPEQEPQIPFPATSPAPPPSGRERLVRKGKKSIRVVAEEQKRRLSRVGKESAFSAVLRRNTKLWGSRVEEVPPGPTRNHVIPESPSGGATTFKWVRGELIGRGSYGRVYLAMNAMTGEVIAVKQVDAPQTLSDKNDSRQTTVVQSLKLESETLKDLDHPNIVQYLGFEETPSHLSIFLEYVPGGSVASCLQKYGAFNEDVTKSFTAQILDGLEYLHSRGILHRDLKADNILVETSGICKISDFGISKRTQDSFGGAETAMKGTVFWMAPEVVNPQGKGYNFKIDIWSVGCVVLEMWAGTRPWQGDEMVAVMFKLYQLKQPPPVPANVSLSESADDFRMKCFAINPDERPTAKELRKHRYLTVSPGWKFEPFE